MEDGLMVIAVLALIASVVGVIKPSLVGMKSRLGAVIGYAIIFIIFLVPALILSPDGYFLK
ncbi:hypothetical protein [Morganella psychrotolerans]|uniref:Uncharacterized protein n=1 Tax=Morganella psychrotolerans TaxID=368603 RepID=A0A1B8HKZ3_9GAMM|nr:hypothetical protein [Morganella psychrotolerans]OBU09870.1 hypothetical protein AYY17_17920 [Morganella psychrotolerans]